jgi:hypothetical protein
MLYNPFLKDSSAGQQPGVFYFETYKLEIGQADY